MKTRCAACGRRIRVQNTDAEAVFLCSEECLRVFEARNPEVEYEFEPTKGKVPPFWEPESES
jgi:hypothetical protein